MKVFLRSSCTASPRDVFSAAAVGAVLRHAQSLTLRVMRCTYDSLGSSAGLCLHADVPDDPRGLAWARHRCSVGMGDSECVAYANGRDDESASGAALYVTTSVLVGGIVLNTYGAGRYATAAHARRATAWLAGVGLICSL